MKNENFFKRPDCDEVLYQKYLWSCNPNHSVNNAIEQIYENQLNQININNEYIENIFKHLQINYHNLMNYEKFRLDTFTKWPHFFVSYKKLAANGFYLKNIPDTIKCHCRKLILYKWKGSNEPMIIHKNFSPNCPHLSGEKTENIPLELNLNGIH